MDQRPQLRLGSVSVRAYPCPFVQLSLEIRDSHLFPLFAAAQAGRAQGKRSGKEVTVPNFLSPSAFTYPLCYFLAVTVISMCPGPTSFLTITVVRDGRGSLKYPVYTVFIRWNRASSVSQT